MDILKQAEKKRVFGFASAAGIVDSQGDTIDSDTLEQAAYDFIFNGTGGEMHEHFGGAYLIESLFITQEKADLLGIAADHVGKWWVGFQVTDDALWDKIKDGSYSMFSIGGRADV